MFRRRFAVFIICAFTLAATSCSANVNPPVLSPSPTVFVPATPESHETEAEPSPTPEPTLPFPETFTNDILRSGIEPVSYIWDACSYFSDRWDPSGSLPGTVVAPIMFHSVLKGNNTNDDPSAINFEQFKEIVRKAERLGFETITTEELLGFLQDNAKIPPRSMILILDDRRPGTAEDYFQPVNEEQGWTTTLAWIIGDTDQREGKRAGESLWDWIERINKTGYFDVQEHGLNHIYLQDNMSEDTVREEIEGAIPILKDHFGHRPIAYIWPGGNYTELGIQIAHEAGLDLGFTIWPRGPIQFNWIPQGEDERSYNDPLMLLPRFWDTAAVLNLEQTAEIGDAAQEFAKENHAAEAAWFSQNCIGELPPLEEIFK